MNKYEKLKLIIKKYETSLKGQIVYYTEYENWYCDEYGLHADARLKINEYVSYHELFSIDS